MKSFSFPILIFFSIVTFGGLSCTNCTTWENELKGEWSGIVRKKWNDGKPKMEIDTGSTIIIHHTQQELWETVLAGDSIHKLPGENSVALFRKGRTIKNAIGLFVLPEKCR